MKMFLCTISLIALTVPEGLAQSSQSAGSALSEYPKFEFFVGYSALAQTEYTQLHFGIFNVTSGLSTPKGLEASLIRNFNNYLGIKADFSAHFRNSNGTAIVTPCPDCPAFQENLELDAQTYNFLFGPELKARNHTRFTPFAHALVGLQHAHATFTTGPALNLKENTSDNVFAMGLGGGVDFRVHRRASLRTQLDYNPAFYGRSSTVANERQNLFRFSFGVLFH